MSDTERGDFGNTPCTDCGEPKVQYKHWGSLVPKGKLGYFCFEDLAIRIRYLKEHGEPKPFPETTSAA